MDSPANLALNNNEDITINLGVTLTVNSDHLYSQQAAYASRVFAFGKYFVDGRDVWWIPFDASSGNVPTLSTFGTVDVTISGTGVGEFLGIWGTLGIEAPNTAGTAIPASGYVKLRRKTGTIANNDILTFSNGATVTVNSATGGQRGWLKMTTSSGVEAHGYQGNIEMLGDWFELGTGNGSTSQTMQFFLPWRCPGIQVETAAGSGVYEWWCNSINYQTNALYLSNNITGGSNPANRTFSCNTAGLITFTNRAVPNGAKVRCPNVVNGTDLAGTNKARGNFKSVGNFKLNKVISGHTVFPDTYPAINIDFSECAFTQLILGSTGLFSAYLEVKIDDCAVSMILQDSGCPPVFSGSAEKITINKLYAVTTCNVAIILISTTTISTTITNSYLHAGASGSALTITSCDNLTITNCEVISTGNSSSQINLTNCNNGYISNIGVESAGGYTYAISGSVMNVSYCSNLIFDNFRHVPGFDNDNVSTAIAGTITTTANSAVVNGTGTNFNTTTTPISSLLFRADGGYLGRISSINSTTQLVLTANAGSVVTNVSSKYYPGDAITRPCSFAWAGFSDNNNIHFRNFGTLTIPYDRFCGRSMLQGSGNKNCSLNKIYCGETGAGWFTIHGYQNKNINVADYIPISIAGSIPFYGNQTGTTRRKLGNNPVTTNRASGKEVPMFNEYQPNNTSITLIYIARDKDPNTEIESDVYSILAGTPTFDATHSALYMPSLNDEITATWTYRIKGLTGFVNSAPTIGGVNTGNIQFTYDIDNGTGFTGTYKALTGANLNAETLNKNGFRLRFKFKTLTANSDNAIYRINIAATTTATDLANYPYPWSNPQIIVTQALSSTLTSLFNTSTGELLAVRQGNGTITMHPEYYNSVPCSLRINKPGYESIDTTITLTEYFQTIPIQQVDTVVTDTNPGSLGITVTNHGASPVTWNSKQWSVTITVTDGSTPATIAQYLSWQRAQNAYNLLGTLHNAALHEAIIPAGTNWETARGAVYGSAGAALKGVRVVDGSGNEIPGFARMQADDGTYYSPAASYTLTVSNIINNSRILVRRTDTSAVIANQVVTTGSFTYTYTHTSDIPIEIIVRKGTTSPYYQEWKTTTTLSNSNNTQTANQISDE